MARQTQRNGVELNVTPHPKDFQLPKVSCLKKLGVKKSTYHQSAKMDDSLNELGQLPNR